MFELSNTKLPQLFKPWNINDFISSVIIIVDNIILFVTCGGGGEATVKVVVFLLTVLSGGEKVGEGAFGLDFHGNRIPVLETVAFDGAC